MSITPGNGLTVTIASPETTITHLQNQTAAYVVCLRCLLIVASMSHSTVGEWERVVPQSLVCPGVVRTLRSILFRVHQIRQAQDPQNRAANSIEQRSGQK